MAGFELTKSIEARHLHPRTGLPTQEPPVTIPFGAVILDPVEDRDVLKFTFLGQNYQCPSDILKPAMTPARGKAATAATPEPAAAQPAAAPEPPPQVVWERLTSNGDAMMRAPVPGGWLVRLASAPALVFVPDKGHSWS